MTRILRLPAVRERTGLSRSSIYAYIARRSLPTPVRLGSRAVGWVESDVEEWIVARVAESRNRDLSTPHNFARRNRKED